MLVNPKALLKTNSNSNFDVPLLESIKIIRVKTYALRIFKFN
jgi:hypothetical protein